MAIQHICNMDTSSHTDALQYLTKASEVEVATSTQTRGLGMAWSITVSPGMQTRSPARKTLIFSFLSLMLCGLVPGCSRQNEGC